MIIKIVCTKKKKFLFIGVKFSYSWQLVDAANCLLKLILAFSCNTTTAEKHFWCIQFLICYCKKAVVRRMKRKQNKMFIYPANIVPLSGNTLKPQRWCTVVRTRTNGSEWCECKGFLWSQFPFQISYFLNLLMCLLRIELHPHLLGGLAQC